ncbi:MAG: glutamate--tRNA ligase [Chitinophagaceae bacterium]|nr:glutamate--tRNA ligase [Chitinophagaceae bacterium]
MSVRVRFAPSPTGGLHLGGVRTVLYNYLFAKHHGGKFIVRIEDTDQTRFVEGAEQYIFDCLKWCGLEPDESVIHGGELGPYKQSERKESYRKYGELLVAHGHAYYAFDTKEELEQMREANKTPENPSPQYDHRIRKKMRNSLNLTDSEVKDLLEQNTPHVIRIKMPEHDVINFTDMIRGEISFDTSLVDDKVLLKADGMPTYHLAVVVDDYLMKITHAFRGEEWLPGAPVHLLLWKYLGWEKQMPQWAHLPLILGPNGKLSKRDGAKYGYPVFAMNWLDPKTNELTEGFKEKGFLPEAFINMLALLGWNAGTEQEVFTMEELIEHFSMERVHAGGAKFDYEKAKWFNHEWMQKKEVRSMKYEIGRLLETNNIPVNDEALLEKVIELVRERCTLLTDFVQQAGFFFKTPETIDADAVKTKWNDEKKNFFIEFTKQLQSLGNWSMTEIETVFKNLAAEKNIKAGELQLPMRVMLVGGKFGPAVFQIAELIGKEETVKRVGNALKVL